MIHSEDFSAMALSFTGTERAPHFDRTAFKVVNKRIFATLHEKSKTVNLVLSLDEQKAFCEYDSESIYPVPNKWGEKGWTTFDLRRVSKEILQEGLSSAYSDVIKPRTKK